MNVLAAMSRNERRAAAKRLERENKQWPLTLCPIPREQWPTNAPPRLMQAWRSREFLVQACDEGGTTRLSINRMAIGADARWSAEITWDELQRLKREAGFGAIDAVEVYPADKDVVNVANMRHLWLVPGGVTFAWRKA